MTSLVSFGQGRHKTGSLDVAVVREVLHLSCLRLNNAVNSISIHMLKTFFVQNITFPCTAIFPKTHTASETPVV